jgi:hypothetical protein
MNQSKTMVVLPAAPAAPAVPTEDRIRILKEWSRSGLSAREYGERTGVPVHRLYRWRQMLEPTPLRVTAAVPFVEVPAVARQPGWGAEVMTRSGAVRLSASVAPSWAGQLIRELSRC